MKITKSTTIGRKRNIHQAHDDEVNDIQYQRSSLSFSRVQLSDITNAPGGYTQIDGNESATSRSSSSTLHPHNALTNGGSSSILFPSGSTKFVYSPQLPTSAGIKNTTGKSCTLRLTNSTYSRGVSVGHLTSPGLHNADNDNTTRINLSNTVAGYCDMGDPVCKCRHCGAIFWYDERLTPGRNTSNPKYGLCCNQGKIKLPFLRPAPDILRTLLFGDSARSKHYRKNIRSYNNMFSFTSMGGKIDNRLNRGNSPPVFKLHGQNYHLMGSLLPEDGAPPKFAQLYIYDTENEVSNRKYSVRQDSSVDDLHDSIISDLKSMLDENNVLVKSFRMAKDRILSEGCTNVKLKLIGRRGGDGRTYNLPSADEVAVLIVGDIDDCQGERDILIETQTGQLQRINQLNPAYLGLQYPLLFPYGEDGYREHIPLSGTNNTGRGRKNVSMREFCAFRLHERDGEAKTILYSGRLTQQFAVDVYTMIESSRLTYIRLNQKRLRCEMYRGLQDALLRGDRDASIQGKRIILPSTFTGGARYMIQNYQDAMAICRWVGYPDLFLTLTCNPKWPEIVRFLDEVGLKAEDRPDIICRIFKVKIEALIKDLRKNKVFGEIKGVVYTIEFQKRGLPHAHILLFLSRDFKCRSPEEIDNIISAEIPDEDEDPEYYAAVRDMMIHGPCGASRKASPCMSNGHCSKHFPKKFCNNTTIDEDGYAVYRRRDNGRTVSKNGVLLDNRYVVPHNRYLLLTYGAHLNVEWCNQSRAIKYLFKYVNKGNDRVTATFYQTNTEDGLEVNIDEVNLYYDCRYVSSCEAVWRIFGFEIQYKDPPVERLSFHLPEEQNVVFSDTDDIQSVMNRETVHQSMFLGWMDANKKFPEGRDLTYSEYPTRFVWKNVSREWLPRKKGFSIGRLFYVPPGSGDLYYLRCLLNIVRGATSYADLRRLNGTQYGTYRDACYALGLLNDDKEYIDGITEASHFASGKSLRSLFVNLLVSSSISRPEVVWNSCWKILSEDILYKQRIYLNHPALVLTEEQIKGFTLAEIEHVLRTHGRSLKEFNTLPFPSQEFFQASSNRLIFDELNYDRELLGKEHDELLSKLNLEQREAYDKILESSLSNIGNIFFVYGYGGTGKTYVWRTISAALRSKGHIVLNVASSGIASLLLPGGRTAHSRFSIPFNIDENSVCNIKQGSPLAELILKCKLIIWDEAPMMHRHCFEALDRSMRDILKRTDLRRSDMPFGGKTIVFGGDFRQILPVIPKGSRQDVVHATINSSHLWSDCIVLRLTTNMRLKSSSSSSDSSSLREYAEWIANIGDGTVNEPNDGVVSIDIPDKFLIDGGSDPIAAMVRVIYPHLNSRAFDKSYYEGRAILAPTLDVVQLVNNYMVSLSNNDGRTYFSSDTSSRSDHVNGFMNDVHTPEFLNSISASGLPNHILSLKVGVPVMLLRNIDPNIGLCNGTRLLITRLGNHVLEGEILSSSSSNGKKVLIPRMSLTPSDSRIPFKFERRQFPLMVSYAMSINKSQGQSLSTVGIILKKPVFSHGQLYVALSRVTNPNGLHIWISDPAEDCSSSRSTTNVVFKEVFQNI